MIEGYRRDVGRVIGCIGTRWYTLSSKLRHSQVCMILFSSRLQQIYNWRFESLVSCSRQVSAEPDLSSPFLEKNNQNNQPLRQAWKQVLLSPGGVLLWLTIPNVKLQPRRYFSSFFMSMAWLSITAYIVCIGSNRINVLWQIPKSFLGLTLVAVGTSWPNLLASVVTARHERGKGGNHPR